MSQQPHRRPLRLLICALLLALIVIPASAQAGATTQNWWGSQLLTSIVEAFQALLPGDDSPGDEIGGAEEEALPSIGPYVDPAG